MAKENKSLDFRFCKESLRQEIIFRRNKTKRIDE